MLFRIFSTLGIAGLVAFSAAQFKGYSVFGSTASEKLGKGQTSSYYHK